MTQLQISLAAMFGLTAAAAVAVVLYQALGMFWILVIAAAIVCMRAPTWDGANPIALALGYMALALLFVCSLCYIFKASPVQAAVPFFLLPALAYIAGLFKGMENA